MSTKTETQTPCVTTVYVVTCYQNIVGIYANQEDAAQIQREMVFKNRPADVLCRSITFTLKND